MQKKDNIPSSEELNEEVTDVADVSEAEAETEADGDGEFTLTTLTYAEGEGKEKKKPKKRLGMVKKQQIMLCAFALLAVTFTLLYFLVFKPDLDEASTPEETPPLELIDGEVRDENGKSVLMFPQITRTNLKNINVKNSYGTFDITRLMDENGKVTSDFGIEQHRGAPFSQEKAAQIAVDAGYPIILSRVTAECEDFSVYGLTEENENLACVTVTALTGESYTFYIGSTVPGGGYYCRVKDRAAVYTVTSSIGETLLTSAEALITPQLGPTTVGTSQTFEIDELLIHKNGEPFVALQSRSYVRSLILAQLKELKNDTSAPISEDLRSAINKYLNTETDDTLQKLITAMEKEKDVEAVKNILQSKDFLFTMKDTFLISAYKMSFPSEYVVDDDNVGNMLLAKLNGLQGSYVFAAGDGVTPLWADDDLMQMCGFYDLENPLFEMYYKYGDEESIIIFADSGSDVYYFAYSYLWDIIVMVEKSLVDFVTWDLLDYCSVYPFMDYIGDVDKLSVSASKLYYKGSYYEVNETFRYKYVTEQATDDKGEIYDKQTLTCYAESTGYSVKGGTVSKNPIQAFYNTALKLKLVGYVAEENFDLENKTEYARLTITYHTGATKELVFYRFGGYCYLEIDGETGVFYTSVTTVNKMLIDAVRAANGFTVNPSDEYADLPDIYISK